jgi:hypothetical protein
MLNKRIGLLVAAVAALAATMLAAPLNASAGLPEFRPGTPLFFTLKSGENRLEASTGENIACLSDLGHGNITGPRTFLALILFHGCKGKNATTGEECPAKTPGQPEGLIHLHVVGELGTIKKADGIITGTIGAIIEPALGTSFFTIQGSCLTEASVTGTLAGEVTPINTPSTTGKLIIGGEKGISDVLEIVVLHKVIKPKLEAFAGLVTASEETHEEITLDGPVEVT